MAGWARLPALLLVTAIVLAGCSTVSTVSGVHHTVAALNQAGFSEADLATRVPNPPGPVADVVVTADQNPSTVARGPKRLPAEAHQVAAVVWAQLPGRFLALTVALRGLGSLTFPHDRLVRLYGPRPGDLDASPVSTAVGTGIRHPVLLGLTALLALVAPPGAAVLVVRRIRRRRAPG